MDYLQSVLEQTNYPILMALLLGLMTAISPCPLATNITATAYISKQITDKKRVLLSGFTYSLGRGFSYTAIGVILYFGASKFHIARFFNQYGEKFLGPILILLGLIFLDRIKLNVFRQSNFQEKLSEKFENKGLLGSFLIGVLFALAFCPYSGALFFGMLIPLVLTSADGLYLPMVFAFGSGLPVILFAYLLAFTASKVGTFYTGITNIEKHLRKLTGGVFIITGVYTVCIFLGIL